MIIWKKKKNQIDQFGLRVRIRFAWFPRREFDNDLSSGEEHGDWFERYEHKKKYQFTWSGMKFYRKCYITRYVNVVLNDLTS